MNYKETLNLPETGFPMKASLAVQEPKRLKKWADSDLYAAIQKKNEGKPLFLLHDGPPYANGHIHFGHILNKVLKDIAVKFRSMTGHSSPYIPGWDCHGLPIEHQVDKNLGKKKRDMSKLEVRQACREYADNFVKIQREEFKRLGVFGEWDQPYRTMDFAYEATIAREFANFVEKGSIYKGLKPVLWCANCRTALAEAEVEYENHTSPSIYVKFAVGSDVRAALPELGDRPASVVIWTTTPWTLPANLAIAFHPDFDYVAVDIDGEAYIVANNCLNQFYKVIGKEGTVLKRFGAPNLERMTCRHPLIERDSLVILSNHVTMDTGTGCVHIAPGHGEDDFVVGRNYGLEPLAPVDGGGRFTEEVGISELIGQKVMSSNEWINERLVANGSMVYQEDFEHSYPHCWRCKRPVIFRSTAQWFLSLSHDDLRQRALDAIRRVHWIPDWGRERIYGMVLNRPDWCLSRQRTWGVPIMAFECNDCGHVLIDADLIRKIADQIDEHGADVWFDEENQYFEDPPACTECNKRNWRRETDILDVWFDSGVSYAAVIEQRLNLEIPIDLYLEGSDQHRGWFHSSLLAAVGARERPPYKAVLTHGFVVDGEGRKYSKSAGNYIPPEKVISESGAEVLRLWVSAEDYRDNIRVSDEILRRLSDAYRKIRNTGRFLLGNISDFDPDADRVSYENLDEIDRYALHLLQKIISRVTKAYEDYAFHTVFHEINRFCTVDLSAFYLDILKDRLYTAPKTGQLRRGSQTVLHEMTRALALLMAPVLCFTADEIWEYLPIDKEKSSSVHLEEFPIADNSLLDQELADKWERLRTVRDAVMRVLEEARRNKLIGNALEAKVELYVEGELEELIDAYQTRLADIFIVSQVELLRDPIGKDAATQDLPELQVRVERAGGEKCERCWKWLPTVGQDPRHPDACHTCTQTLLHL